MKLQAAIFLALLMLSSCAQSTEEDQDTATLEGIESPTGINASLPYLTQGDDNLLYMSWVEKRDSGWTDLKYSVLMNGAWQAPEVAASGDHWFVNWADYPMVSANQQGQLIAHFLAKSSAGKFSYDVNVIRRQSDAWSEAFVIHDDNTTTEHGFVTLLPQDDGQFRLAWLDGRNTGGEGHGGHGQGGTMTVRTALMDINGNLSDEFELDNRVCDCCQTSGANTENGPVFVYRDRSAMEIRDMSIVRKVNGNWTEPKTVYEDGWEISGCPVNGPRVSAIGNTLSVAWFSAPNQMPQVKIIFSEDGGETFGDAFMVDGFSPLGRVDVAMIDQQRALLTWMTKAENGTEIRARIVGKDGTMEKPITIATSDESRGSGFPQLEIVDGIAYFAWTVIEGENTSIRLASMKL